jgi:predicted nucleic acid binding AN1-type Zn finger protein
MLVIAPKTVNEGKLPTSGDLFAQYSSDEHLRSILRKQANSLGQVIVTIIGGDSYSIFAWDWYERMLEISNDTDNCHCFVIAMDEIAVIIATQQGIPVFYSTFSFEQQMQWINTIEARQHSLYRVGHAKFDSTARIVRLGFSVMLSEMDVFW